jgi:CRISPR-associated protein Cas1
MWGQIVRSKIHRQSEVIQKIGKTGVHLQRIANKVLDGDPSNCEAEAAKTYWRDLFGDGFRRHSDDVINARLNYGYAILRATVARYVCAHGLSPSLGIHHRNATNPMCLVDDLMEPFRPLIDWKVAKIGCMVEIITKEQRMDLVGLMAQKVRSDRKSISFESLIKASVFSFYEVCSNPNAVLKVEWDLPEEC